MRYFLLGWLLLCVVVVGIAGFRGGTARKPPIYVFPDMDRQAKLRPQEPNNFFPDGLASRLKVTGSIPRSEPYAGLIAAANAAPVYPHDDHPVNTGTMTGSTNFVETNPFQVSSQFLARGQERYQIYCAPCHGGVGDGNGPTKKLGMATVANLHDPRIVKLADGELFHVISNGRNTMYPYAAQIDAKDRWAIVAYVRALHLARLGSLDDVPQQFRANLK